MGRKALPPDERRSKSIHVKVTAREQAIIQALAKDRGAKGAGAIMRDLALRTAKRARIQIDTERRR